MKWLYDHVWSPSNQTYQTSIRAFHVILLYPGIPVPSNRLFLAKSWEISLAAATFHHSASGSSSPVSWCFCHMDDWCPFYIATTSRCLNSGMDAEAHTCDWSQLSWTKLEVSSVDLDLPNVSFSKEDFQTWQTTCKINSWELRPDLYLVHRKGFAVTVKSSRAAALQGFLVTQPSRKATAQKDQNTDSAEKT